MTNVKMFESCSCYCLEYHNYLLLYKIVFMKIDNRNDLATLQSCRCIEFIYNNIKSIGGVVESFTLAYKCRDIWLRYNDNDNNIASCNVILKLYDMYWNKIKCLNSFFSFIRLRFLNIK